MTRKRGEVVWHPAMFAKYERPFLLVSTDENPFQGEEYVALSVTTTELPDAIPIDDDDWELGSLPEQSRLKPWNPMVLKEASIGAVAGVLSDDVVDRAVDSLARICGR